MGVVLSLVKFLKNQPIKNKKVSYWLLMDEFNEQSIKDYLGENCFQNDSQMDIFLLGRQLKNIPMLPNEHWAWLLEFKSHPTHRYATVEFSDQGILLGIYEAELNLNPYDVCSTIVGDSEKIVFTSEFKTERRWGEILMKLVEMKQNYPASSYNLITYNCRTFVKELGIFLSPYQFTNSQFNNNCLVNFLYCKFPDSFDKYSYDFKKSNI